MLVQTTTREVSHDVILSAVACWDILRTIQPHGSLVVISRDAVLQPLANRTEFSRTIRGREGQTAGTIRQQDRTETKQLLLSECSHHEFSKTLRKKVRQQIHHSIVFHNIVLMLVVFPWQQWQVALQTLQTKLECHVCDPISNSLSHKISPKKKNI